MDDTTILYSTEELPYWELNDENCLAVLAKKPVDQLGSADEDGDEYDEYADGNDEEEEEEEGDDYEVRF